MPIDDAGRWLLQVAPPMVALAVAFALPMAAALLVTPAPRRARAAILAGAGLLLGGVALVNMPGLQGPFRYDPFLLAMLRLAHIAAVAVLVAGMLCLLAAVVSLRRRPHRSPVRAVLGCAAGLLIGIGAPIVLWLLLARPLWAMAFHGGIGRPAIVGVVTVAVLTALLTLAGSRRGVIRIGIVAGAVPAGVLTAAAGGALRLRGEADALSTRIADVISVPTSWILVISVTVGVIGAVGRRRALRRSR